MATAKRTAKSKLIEEVTHFQVVKQEYLEDVKQEDLEDVKQEDLEDSPKAKGKKSHRCQNSDQSEVEEMSKLIGAKKKKVVESNVENTTEFGQKILNLVNHQLEARKECSEKLFKMLAAIAAKADADYKQSKKIENSLGHLTNTLMKCVQQSTAACKLNLEALKETSASFQNEFNAMELKQIAENHKLMDELEYGIKKLQDKLTAEGKKSAWESIRQNILHVLEEK